MIFKLTPHKIRYLKIIGVALFLIIFSCERDEVQVQSTETLSQQEAMNMFLKTYTGNQDNFCDEVVDRLLGVNDSTGIIFDLARKYGQPQWNIDKTSTTKSYSYFVTPVCVPKKDSVSAVFVFLEQDFTLYLEIFEASNPDTLISDLALAYQCILFPHKKYTTRKAIPVKSNSKTLDKEVECWISLTSTDGGTTWYVTNTSCTTTIIDTGGGEKIDLGPISDPGGGDPNPGTTTISPKISSLSPTAQKNLEAAKIEIDQFCPGHTILSTVWNSSLTIKTNSSLTSVGDYNSKTGLMQFHDAEGITDIALLHELTHAYQSYLGGANVNTQTMEFEAWLMEDLYLINQGADAHHLTWSQNLPYDGRNAYYNWAKSMLSLGQVHCDVEGYNFCTMFRDEFVKFYPAYQDYPTGNGNLFAVSDLVGKCNN